MVANLGPCQSSQSAGIEFEPESADQECCKLLKKREYRTRPLSA